MQIKNFFVFGFWVMLAGAAWADLTQAEQDALDRKTVTSKYYVDQQVATKQAAIGPETGNYVVMYPDSTGNDTNHDGPGEIDKKHIADVLSGTASDNVAVGTGDIPTVGAVNTGLATKQGNITLPSGKTAGDVVTYTSNAGVVGSHDVYRSNQAYNANGLIEAAHANAAIQNGLNQHLTCGGTVDGTANGTCWLWTIQDQTGSPVYTPHTN